LRLVDEFQGELLELVYQLAQLARVVEQRLVLGQFLVGENPADGLAVDLARPKGIGPV